ncbi:MAG TPA: hypothetical protein VK618_13540, partial [Flavitalea sp.]|nr:hypothetical protein [Flavitalea sp.]
MKKILLPLAAATFTISGCGTASNQKNSTTETTINGKSSGHSEPLEFKDRSNAESFITIDPAFASKLSAYTLI